MTNPPQVVPRLEEKVFAVWCEDAPDAAGLRQQRLDGHLSYVERHHERYLVAGPLRQDGEQALCGSLFLVIAADEADARAFLSGDPYFSEGVYGRVAIRSFTPAAGRWMGGVIWRSAEELRALADGGR